MIDCLEFKAWDKITKKMCYVNSLTLDFKTADIWDGDKNNDGECREFKDIELIQYIGKKDKNGEKLYGTDIIECENELYEITWIPIACMYTAQPIIKYGGRLGVIANWTEVSLKVGNRFETPKLLEVK